MSGFSRPLCSPTHPGLDPVAVKETRSIPRAIARALQWALGASLVTAACFVAPGTSHADSSAKFIPAKPTEKSQTQKSVEERGGINPCNTKEPKPGVYLPWNRGPSIGQMIMPARGGVTKDGKFDVVIHFHGHDPIRREFVQVMDGAVLVGITLGIGSGAYESTFSNPGAFKELIESVEKEVAKERGLDHAKVRKVALSAWSAGYGAVGQILRQSYGKELVDSVILLDGLHVGYAGDGSLERAGLEPFIDFAKRAKSGKRFMFASHSSIIPPGYASTTETMNYLVHELGGSPKKAKPRKSDPMGLELNSRYDAGNFHVRGYDGNDKMDHCAHIGVIRDVLKSFIKPRWKTPKGQAPKAGGGSVEAAAKPGSSRDHKAAHGDKPKVVNALERSSSKDKKKKKKSASQKRA